MAVTAHSSAYTGDVNDWALKDAVFGPFTVGVASGTVVLGTDGTYPLMTFPEPVDIEKISIRLTTLAAADPDSIQFAVAASGTALGSATAITAAEPLTTNANALLAANTTVDIPFSAVAQIDLASGTTLALVTSGTIVSAAGLMITVVYRKKPTRRDRTDATSKVDKTKYFYAKN